MTITLDLHIRLASWRHISGLRPRLAKAAEAVHNQLPKKFGFPATATVLLTGNAAVRRLNHDFRGIDKATNVLSFPQFNPGDLPKMGKLGGPVELGDIALAYQYVVFESKLEHKILINHITHLVIHGLLHLFGYDHMDEGEAVSMERLEARVMKEMGLADPYAPLPAITKHAKKHKDKQ